jgi:hypothetical protein
MDNQQKIKIYQQIMWDYNFTPNEIELLISGKCQNLGHYTKENIFRKILESYSWFTILQIYTPVEIRNLLTDDLVKSLRMPSLRLKYAYVRERLFEIIPASG